MSREALADFACDYCGQRKIKCSRELPKCSNCRKWPGPCTYSHERRDATIWMGGVDAPQSQPVLLRRSAASSVEDRLTSIEEKLDSLTASIQNLTSIMERMGPNHASRYTPLSSIPSVESTPSASGTVENRIDATHASWFLEQASSDLKQLRSGVTLTEGLDGSESLQDLSRAFSTVHFDTVHFDDDILMQEAKKSAKSGKVFFIPDHAEGIALIAKFSALYEVGGPLFLRPTPETLQEVVFNPSGVSPFGWVVVFNLLLSTSMGTRDKLSHCLRTRLRWNTWVALSDSTLYLEPCEANIQALLFVATHGEDFATPNLSFIVTGHACRLAQALDLHLLRPHDDDERQQRRLFLLWSLFIIDKAVSLAFGRPPALSMEFYDRVPLPDSSVLARFNPHTTLYGGDVEPGSIATSGGIPNTFGGGIVLHNVLLARLSGEIASYLISVNHVRLSGKDTMATIIEKDHLKSDLEDWYKKAHASLSRLRDLDNLTKMEKARKEMDLGIDTMLFQYYHLLVILTRSFEDDQETCLHSARNALSMLDRLVSTLEQVYNGIVWLLLYYPFTPFFVLFGNITRNPFADDAEQDLHLLKTATIYYSKMTSQGVMASKLERIAQTFASIAERHMIRARSHISVPAMPNEAFASSLGTKPPEMDGLVENDRAEDSLLSWFSDADFLTFGMPGQEIQHNSSVDFAQAPDSIAEDGSQDQRRGTKRPLQCTFDWFSWDLNNLDKTANV